MMLKTPIVLIIYRRPESTRGIVNDIRKVRPKTVFVVADGPKNKADEKNCELARDEIEKINWECKVYKKYSSKNRGIRKNVVSGLNWVFSKVERAIVLEDDLKVDTSFFRYCEELLDKYENDKRIISITGSNFLNGRIRLKDSYFFSRYVYSWGWATWKRAWVLYDSEMLDWQKFRKHGFLEDYFHNFTTALYWRYIFNTARSVDTWDFQWSFTAFKHRMLTAVPSVNLISNVGYGATATHTAKKSNFLELSTNSLQFPLKHPRKVERNREADFITEWTIYLNPRIFVGLIGRYLLEKVGFIKQKKFT